MAAFTKLSDRDLANMSNQGTALYNAGRFIEAEPYWTACLVHLKALLGDQHPSTLGVKLTYLPFTFHRCCAP